MIYFASWFHRIQSMVEQNCSTHDSEEAERRVTAVGWLSLFSPFMPFYVLLPPTFRTGFLFLANPRGML
jgi:hypothetical protein